MNLKRRLPQYLLGLLVMATGVVLIKQAAIGISPLSAIPAALSNITPFTFGNMTIAFHTLCVLMQMLLMRRITAKTVLILPLSIAFGYMIDLLDLLIPLDGGGLLLRAGVCLAGIVASALGIAIITGADLMLPAPDALLRQLHAQWGKPLSLVKTLGDILWVLVTIAIELLSGGKIVSIGVGTVAAVLLTGVFVGLFKRWFPGLQMPETAKNDKP